METGLTAVELQTTKVFLRFTIASVLFSFSTLEKSSLFVKAIVCIQAEEIFFVNSLPLLQLNPNFHHRSCMLFVKENTLIPVSLL
jgi:hypothetical protein